MKALNTNKLRVRFEEALDQYVKQSATDIELLKPMLYSLKGGGKRVRPLLLLSVLRLNQHKSVELGLSTAIALEYIHTYSLIHDDLPAMDNDDLRRGQPTSHIQFDEATAILTGDALLTDAFGVIAEDKNLRPKVRVKLLQALSRAAGSVGMVAGQLKDIQAEEQVISLDQLQEIHALKTGCLFNFAVEAGAVIAGLEAEKAHFKGFSDAFGIAYQIHNDLMDVQASEVETGKQTGQDAVLQKATYPSILGLEESYQALDEQMNLAEASLKQLTQRTGRPYMELMQFMEYLDVVR
ncbi:geranyl transferase [Suicoccus acidiformans]|uniref:Farnesyl diphosphate synthase n=1 Tax=Suicoccus acidiformans TaxID=2036206 RepID=A0A347WJD3_9LACT|nr:farnesyl diphosphate synthase [Suicoccus acidiformans]AXY25190.1 geranyl transferase [Suicoccus acidiformans]